MSDLPIVRIETPRGTIEVELFEDDAPNTVANFVSLIEKSFYDGCTFHRVVPNFVIQGGDPHSRTGAGRVGTGGPGYCIACEINARKHKKGTLSMAHAGKDTGGSQFFICHGPQPHLDGKHTVFGQVTQGLEIVDLIQQGDKMKTVTVVSKRAHPYEPKTLPGR